jgi:hypothetical protein
VIEKEPIVIPKEVSKVLEAEGRIINRPTQTGGKIYDKYFVYVPIPVAKDSNFPFKANDKVLVKIDREKGELIIKKTRRT